MTIKQLEYFMEIARCLSFSEAARRLYVSQSALSRSMAALEEELDVILFFRDSHRMALTPAGLVLATTVPKLAAELEQAVGMVQQAKEGMRGRLRIAVASDLGLPELLSSTLQYFRKSLPFMELQIQCLEPDALLRALDDGSMDLGYSWLWPEAAPLEHLTLEQVPYVLVGAAEQVPAAPELPEMLNETMIFAGPSDNLAARRWQSYCHSRGRDARLLPCPDSASQRLLLEQGWGFSLLPANHRSTHEPQLRACPLPELQSASCALLWTKGNLNPVLDVFLRLIRSDM